MEVHLCASHRLTKQVFSPIVSPGEGSHPVPNVDLLWTLPVRGLAPPPLIFGSYGPFETLLILVTKNLRKKLKFPKHPK